MPNQLATRTNNVWTRNGASSGFQCVCLSVCVCNTWTIYAITVHFFLLPSGGDGGSGGIMEWVFASFQQALHMASCLLCLFIASFWETLHSPRMQHKPKHLSVPSPEPVAQGILLFLPYFSSHTFSHLSSPPPPVLLSCLRWTRIFVFGAWA